MVCANIHNLNPAYIEARIVKLKHVINVMLVFRLNYRVCQQRVTALIGLLLRLLSLLNMMMLIKAFFIVFLLEQNTIVARL